MAYAVAFLWVLAFWGLVVTAVALVRGRRGPALTFGAIGIVSGLVAVLLELRGP